MTTAQVVETSVTVNNNSPIQNYVHPDDQTQPTFEMTPRFKPFTLFFLSKQEKKCPSNSPYVLVVCLFDGVYVVLIVEFHFLVN